jgi:hypothetical protein
VPGNRDFGADAVAVEQGGRPHPRADIAEFHLRAGRHKEAAAIWAELKASDPDDVWLYNAAGLSYNEIGEHELAVAWLGEGIELAMRIDDPEGIINQLSDVRRQSLAALGRDLDELEERVDPFLEAWRPEEQTARRRPARPIESANNMSVIRDAPRVDELDREQVAVSISWFPSGEYEEAIKRWPSLAVDWADVPHADYCRRLDGNIKWMRSQGVPIRAIAPIVVEDYAAWCAEHDEDPRKREPSMQRPACVTAGRSRGRPDATSRAGAARGGSTRSAADSSAAGRAANILASPAIAPARRPPTTVHN